MTDVNKLVATYPLISDQVDTRELTIVLETLQKSLLLPGSVVEFGCYVGTTSLFISRLLRAESPEREFHVYDSFAGLPEKQRQDLSPVGMQFQAGELTASKKDFVRNYTRAGLSLPIIHKGWFDTLTSDSLPIHTAFAFLDGDYYASVRTSLALVWPRLVPGASVIIDDYANEALPGAAKAVNEWRTIHPCSLRVEHSMAILTI